MKLMFFSITVLFTGWVIGYYLAKESNRKGQLMTPETILLSLLAVTAPTGLAFILSSDGQQITSQFSLRFPLSSYLIAIFFPLLIALVGHLSAVISAQKNASFIPSKIRLKRAAEFLPVALIWGLLEEMGWRGYFFSCLTNHMQPLVAALMVGLLWGAWHVPQMLTNNALKKSCRGKLIQGMALWVGQCLSLSVIFSFLQLKTGSFILPALSHALVNTYERASVGMSTDDYDNRDLRWAGNISYPALCCSLILCFFLISRF